MKKVKIISLLISIFLYSCTSKKEITIKIRNSTKKITKTIFPDDNVGYTTKYIQVRGYSNDSIYIKFDENGIPFYLQKKIDTTISGDYYGEGEVKFIFDAYKSKNNDLTINFGILGSK